MATTSKATTKKSNATATTVQTAGKTNVQPSVVADRPKPRPYRGIYVLADKLSDAELNAILKDPCIAGLSLRATWSEVAPTEVNHSWLRWDRIIQKVADAGKGVMLRVLAGKNCPMWLYDHIPPENVVQYANEDGLVCHMPEPWDKVWLNKWAVTLNSFAERYRDLGCVRIAAVTGPAEGGEMHLGDEGNKDLWEQHGYNDEDQAAHDLYGAWSAVHGAFDFLWRGKVTLCQAISRPTKGFGHPEDVVEWVASSALSHNMALWGNWLSAKLDMGYLGVGTLKQYALAGHPVGFQLLCPAANRSRFGGDGTVTENLKDAFDKGFAIGGKQTSVFEIYPSDMLLRDAIVYASGRLGQS